MTKQSGIQALMQAVQQYFNLMYDSDVSHFDRVFRPTAQLHGLRDGKMRMLTAQAYREILAGAPSPRSQEHVARKRFCWWTSHPRVRRWRRCVSGSTRSFMSTISAITMSMTNGLSVQKPSTSKATQPRRRDRDYLDEVGATWHRAHKKAQCRHTGIPRAQGDTR
jgi:hypothetical protein